MSRSDLTKGKSASLSTAFNGRPAPGGAFYPESKHYRKVCKSPKAGRHPYRDALGGIDAPIVEELQRRGCETIELQLADKTVHYALFQDLMTSGFLVRWKDRRFPARWYLGGPFWCSTVEALRDRQSALQAEQLAREPEKAKAEAPKLQQLDLFDGQVSRDAQRHRRLVG